MPKPSPKRRLLVKLDIIRWARINQPSMITFEVYRANTSTNSLGFSLPPG